MSWQGYNPLKEAKRSNKNKHVTRAEVKVSPDACKPQSKAQGLVTISSKRKLRTPGAPWKIANASVKVKIAQQP